MTSANRKARRASEKLARARVSGDVKARQERFGLAQAEVQRLKMMLQAAQEGLQLASSIPPVTVPDPDDAEKEIPAPADPETGDPNAFRTAAVDDFSDRFTDTRERLICALEEQFLALEGLDPKLPGDADIQVVPAGTVVN